MAYLPATNQVRISTLTFLGDRRDIVADLHHILPAGDKGLIQGLEVVGHSGTFRYSARYGQIIDSDLMIRVLYER